jgi:hypothetical protein
VDKAAKIHDVHSPDVQKKTDAKLTEMITDGKRSSRGLSDSMPSNKAKLTNAQIQ